MTDNRQMKYLEIYNEWISNQYIDEDDRQELIDIKGSNDEIKDRFYKDLEFGTGGLRGVIGIGTNRINIYTIRKATQGLANHLLKTDKKSREKGVAIAYDSRHYSALFAKEAALVMAGNKIKVYLFESLRSTPELSFSVRHLGCAGGIVITASHNPPEYNGYKVYNCEGGQLTEDAANNVISQAYAVDTWDKINRLDEKSALENDLLNIIGEDVDNAYLEKVVDLIDEKKIVERHLDLNIVYTPLHGSGLMPVTCGLARLGYGNIQVVRSQAMADGNFPTVNSPNPEDPVAFKQGIEMAENIGAEVIIGTDPDCDRIGVVVKDSSGEYNVLSGNQTGALLVDYVIKSIDNQDTKYTIIKTIVTSDLGAAIAKAHNVNVINTLTGFKYIAEKIKEIQETKEQEFLIGYEESYGYLAGTFVRDKDAVIACCLIVDMVSYYKEQGKNLYDALQDLYKEYGYYVESLETFVFRGADGIVKMQGIMKNFRDNKQVCDISCDIESIEDYENKTTYYTSDCSTKENITLPKSNVIKMILKDGSWIAVRPSGTEPKLKVYYSFINEDMQKAENKMDEVKKCIRNFIS